MGNDCIKKFCSGLKELGTKVVNYEQKETTPLTDDENRYCEEQKNATYVKKRFAIIKNKKRDLNYTKKLEIIVTLQENLEGLFIAFVIYTIKYRKKFL